MEVNGVMMKTVDNLVVLKVVDDLAGIEAKSTVQLVLKLVDGPAATEPNLTMAGTGRVIE